MEILTAKGFKKFNGFSTKQAKCIRMRYTDDFNNTFELEGSEDHRVKIELMVNGIKSVIWRELKDLDIGDKLYNESGNFIVRELFDIGENTVYTPVDVDGLEYLTDKVSSHNCKFAGSSDTLIDGDIIDGLTSLDPVGYKYGYDMNIYEEPVENAMYVMGVDSAMGNAGDYSVVQVIRVFGRDKYRQVAVYRRNTIRAEDFAEVVHSISEWYNNALYVIENNDIGRSVADALYYDIGDGNMVSTDRHGNLGTRADRNTKIDACKILKTMIEKGHLTLVDGDTIDELSRFEEVSPMVFKGAAGKHDDLVSALYWAAYCLTQPEVDLDGLKVVEAKRYDDALPPPMYADFGGANPFGAGITDQNFWAGLN